MTELLIMSRKEVEQVMPEDSIVLISISDFGSLFPRINRGFRSVLFLNFNDVDANDPFAMSQKQAQSVARFATAWWGATKFMIVQCEAGISRSSGVASAISKSMTGEDGWIFNNNRFVPNMHCRKLVLNCLQNIAS